MPSSSPPPVSIASTPPRSKFPSSPLQTLDSQPQAYDERDHVGTHHPARPYPNDLLIRSRNSRFSSRKAQISSLIVNKTAWSSPDTPVTDLVACPQKYASRIKIRGRARREAEKVARRDARTEDLAIRNERLAYVQENIDEDERSRHDGTTRARRPAAAAHVRTFPPDTTDRIPSCLEEEFPRFATATENFPPEITKDNIRQRYNDYQSHIDWCADRSPCSICGGSFQGSDSVSLYSQQRLIDLENRHELDSCAVRDDG
ncbi:hypothetical protein V8E54_012356 [Elaphomyces granulatus]